MIDKRNRTSIYFDLETYVLLLNEYANFNLKFRTVEKSKLFSFIAFHYLLKSRKNPKQIFSLLKELFTFFCTGKK